MSHPIPAFSSVIVPVVVLEQADDALPMAEALLEGGIDVIEVTLRRPGGLPGIAKIARQLPNICVGAGTLLSADDVKRAIDAGAGFGLSPGSSPTLVDAVLELGLPFIPGVATPSDIMQAHDAGFSLMKLFPAAQLGGIDMLKALQGPFANVRFCPTGGVNLANLSSYLALPNVAMVGGSWLTPASAVARRQWHEITALARQAAITAAQASHQS
jgi:2-dehydro-3-deoxyphosphogluconate aldolase / (4S)-4-hydroxy-2-oxoglutarate aldolase